MLSERIFLCSSYDRSTRKLERWPCGRPLLRWPPWRVMSCFTPEWPRGARQAAAAQRSAHGLGSSPGEESIPPELWIPRQGITRPPFPFQALTVWGSGFVFSELPSRLTGASWEHDRNRVVGKVRFQTCPLRCLLDLPVASVVSPGFPDWKYHAPTHVPFRNLHLPRKVESSCHLLFSPYFHIFLLLEENIHTIAILTIF